MHFEHSKVWVLCSVLDLIPSSCQAKYGNNHVSKSPLFWVVQASQSAEASFCLICSGDYEYMFVSSEKIKLVKAEDFLFSHEENNQTTTKSNRRQFNNQSTITEPGPWSDFTVRNLNSVVDFKSFTGKSKLYYYLVKWLRI